MSFSKKPTHTTPFFFSNLPIAVIAIVTISLVSLFGMTLPAHAAAPSGKWVEVFSDNFNESSVSNTNWKPYNNTYGDGNNEIACLTPNNVAVSGGSLKITAKREKVTCPGNTSPDYFTSGFLGSREVNKYYPAFGRYEVRAKIPHGQGLWPAFWLRHKASASVAEVDVMEYFHATEPGKTMQTLHFPNEIGYNVAKKSAAVETPTTTPGWHTWAVEITPLDAAKNSAKITMFTDGVKTFEYTPSKFGWLNNYDKNAMFDIAINMAVGGNYVGHPDDALGYSRWIGKCLSPWMGAKPCDSTGIKRATFPNTYEVDYVKVSKFDTTVDTTAPKVSITAPSANNAVNGSVKLAANTSDNVGVKKVDYYVGSTLISSATSNPYSVTWNTAKHANGVYKLTAKAYDTNNNVGTSTPITVTVKNFSTQLKLSAGTTKTVNGWSADNGYTAGTTASRTNSVNTSKVASPAPQSVYQHERYGNFSYTLKNLDPNKYYALALHFNEFYWNKTGERVFDVTANGSTLLKNFDVLATAGGKNVAIAKTFSVKPDSSGNVSLKFITRKDNAKISGISITQMSTAQ